VSFTFERFSLSSAADAKIGTPQRFYAWENHSDVQHKVKLSLVGPKIMGGRSPSFQKWGAVENGGESLGKHSTVFDR